jgi:hypothetical protein
MRRLRPGRRDPGCESALSLPAVAGRRKGAGRPGRGMGSAADWSRGLDADEKGMERTAEWNGGPKERGRADMTGRARQPNRG